MAQELEERSATLAELKSGLKFTAGHGVRIIVTDGHGTKPPQPPDHGDDSDDGKKDQPAPPKPEEDKKDDQQPEPQPGPAPEDDKKDEPAPKPPDDKKDQPAPKPPDDKKDQPAPKPPDEKKDGPAPKPPDEKKDPPPEPKPKAPEVTPSMVAELGDSDFAFDKTFLLPRSLGAFKSLKDACARLKGDKHVLIVGHADAKGSADYNQKLSQERAQSLLDFLQLDEGAWLKHWDNKPAASDQWGQKEDDLLAGLMKSKAPDIKPELKNGKLTPASRQKMVRKYMELAGPKLDCEITVLGCGEWHPKTGNPEDKANRRVDVFIFKEKDIKPPPSDCKSSGAEMKRGSKEKHCKAYDAWKGKGEALPLIYQDGDEVHEQQQEEKKAEVVEQTWTLKWSCEHVMRSFFKGPEKAKKEDSYYETVKAVFTLNVEIVVSREEKKPWALLSAKVKTSSSGVTNDLSSLNDANRDFAFWESSPPERLNKSKFGQMFPAETDLKKLELRDDAPKGLYDPKAPDPDLPAKEPGVHFRRTNNTWHVLPADGETASALAAAAHLRLGVPGAASDWIAAFDTKIVRKSDKAPMWLDVTHGSQGEAPFPGDMAQQWIALAAGTRHFEEMDYDVQGKGGKYYFRSRLYSHEVTLKKEEKK